MNDPWQILILDRNVATERDVKSAYARLLKQHRPDVDPGGFQRVNEAYQAALAWVRDRTEVGCDGVAEPVLEATGDASGTGEDPGATAPEPPTEGGQEWRNRVENVRDIALTGDAARVRQALDDLVLAPEAASISPDGLMQSLAYALGGNLAALAGCAGDAFLVRLVQHGNCGLVHQIVSYWNQENDVARLCAFAGALHEAPAAQVDAESAVVLARVASLIGYWRHDLATALADAAYPHLPTDIRQPMMGELDREVALGRLFFGFPPEMRRFWHERITAGGKIWDWDDNASREAMDYVVKNRGHSWDGLPLIQQIVPPEVWRRAEKPLQKQAKAADRALGGGGSGFSLRWIWLLVVVVGNLVRHCPNDTPSRSYRTDAPWRGSEDTWRALPNSNTSLRRLLESPRKDAGAAPPKALPVTPASQNIRIPVPESRAAPPPPAGTVPGAIPLR